MTKNLLLSVSPTEALNVLNGKQTALLRKRVPKGYVGWCYGVVSKKLSGRMVFKKGEDWYGAILSKNIIAKYPNHFENEYGGRIPFRFWYEEVEEVKEHHLINQGETWYTINEDGSMFYDKLCLDVVDVHKYLGMNNGYAISITKLEVFDKPMELGEFYSKEHYQYQYWLDRSEMTNERKQEYVDMREKTRLTKAPSTYQYVWVKE